MSLTFWEETFTAKGASLMSRVSIEVDSFNETRLVTIDQVESKLFLLWIFAKCAGPLHFLGSEISAERAKFFLFRKLNLKLSAENKINIFSLCKLSTMADIFSLYSFLGFQLDSTVDYFLSLSRQRTRRMKRTENNFLFKRWGHGTRFTLCHNSIFRLIRPWIVHASKHQSRNWRKVK